MTVEVLSVLEAKWETELREDGKTIQGQYNTTHHCPWPPQSFSSMHLWLPLPGAPFYVLHGPTFVGRGSPVASGGDTSRKQHQ
jgi:hypothetical protein